MTVFVTGGSGFVGAHVVRALLEDGERVRCLVRSPEPATLVGLPVEQVPGDVRDAASLEAGLAGCSAAFHCAADYRLYARHPREIYDTNVGGTTNVLAAAERAGVRDVVVTSSVGALATGRSGVPANEETPVGLEDMVGHYKRSKFLAELEARRAADAGRRVFLVHPSTPIGELDVKPTPTGKIVLDFLRGKLPAVVDTSLNFVDVRDVARGHLLARQRGEPGRRYILGNQNLTLREFLDLVAEASGRVPVRWTLPHWIPMVAGALSTGFARVTGTEPAVAWEAVKMSRAHMVFDASRAVKELGLPQSDLRDAVARAVAWFREGTAPGAGAVGSSGAQERTEASASRDPAEGDG